MSERRDGIRTRRSDSRYTQGCHRVSGNTEFLAERGIAVVVLDDEPCIELMQRSIRERPDICYEEVTGNEHL
jgi:hypothetical protein